MIIFYFSNFNEYRIFSVNQILNSPRFVTFGAKISQVCPNHWTDINKLTLTLTPGGPSGLTAQCQQQCQTPVHQCCVDVWPSTHSRDGIPDFHQNLSQRRGFHSSSHRLFLLVDLRPGNLFSGVCREHQQPCQTGYLVTFKSDGIVVSC